MSIDKGDLFEVKVEFDSLKRDLRKINSDVDIGYNCDIDLNINGCTVCYFDSYDENGFEFLSSIENFSGNDIMPLVIKFYKEGRKILSKYQEVK